MWAAGHGGERDPPLPRRVRRGPASPLWALPWQGAGWGAFLVASAASGVTIRRFREGGGIMRAPPATAGKPSFGG